MPDIAVPLLPEAATEALDEALLNAWALTEYEFKRAGVPPDEVSEMALREVFGYFRDAVENHDEGATA